MNSISVSSRILCLLVLKSFARSTRADATLPPSSQIHVVTEVTGEDAEELDMSPMDRLGRDDASAHFDTSNRSYHRDGQQITPPLTTPTLSHVISDSDDGYDDESVSKSSFSNSKTALR